MSTSGHDVASGGVEGGGAGGEGGGGCLTFAVWLQLLDMMMVGAV